MGNCIKFWETSSAVAYVRKAARLIACGHKKLKAYYMLQHLAHIALVVRDYDEAIAFYTQKLHFDLIEDTQLSDSKRWVLIAPKGSKECRLLLTKADNDIQAQSIGNQTGGRVFLFLYMDDIATDYQNLLA